MKALILILILFTCSVSKADIQISVTYPNNEMKYFDSHGTFIKVGPYKCDLIHLPTAYGEVVSATCTVNNTLVGVNLACGDYNRGHYQTTMFRPLPTVKQLLKTTKENEIVNPYVLTFMCK